MSTQTVERDRLEALLLQLQRERIALTCEIMNLREERAQHRPRTVLAILVALLRLERANRRTAAALSAPGSASSASARPPRPARRRSG